MEEKAVGHLNKLKRFAKHLKKNVYVLYLAYRHSKTPWYAKAFSLLLVAYAVSPIDLIPDVIPVLGYLDEAILLPLGIWGAFRMIPEDVLAECRAAASQSNTSLRKSWPAAVVIILIWVGLAAWFFFEIT
ncbi:MAG TPA: YkvA family protein [Bacillales bacterium]|nr:YkvA family protein [Bacillales bacterium]